MQVLGVLSNVPLVLIMAAYCLLPFLFHNMRLCDSALAGVFMCSVQVQVHVQACTCNCTCVHMLVVHLFFV